VLQSLGRSWLPRAVPEAARMAAALLFVGGTSVAAENALMPAHVFPTGDRWIAYLTSLVFIGLSFLMAKRPERMPVIIWPVLSMGSVVVIVLLSVGSRDPSAASQIALCLPVLLAGYHFRAPAAAAVLIVAVAGDFVVCFGLLPFDDALEDAIGVSILLIALTIILIGARSRIDATFALLQEQADHDPLTGLANRRVFDHDIVGAIDAADLTGVSSALLLIDIDNFKSVNDTFGHTAGDALLCDLAGCLRAVCRPDDRIYRIGGDELAVLLRDCPVGVAVDRAEEIRAAVEAMAPIFDRHHQISTTVSVGLADTPMHGRHPRDLMRSADQALYEAKDAGRNRVRAAA
jgi:diguanylate cyclase (GGDEF)-like protein